MAYSKSQQARLDAGLCHDCGKPRAPGGGGPPHQPHPPTETRCGPCAAALRARDREKTRQRKAGLLPPKPRDRAAVQEQDRDRAARLRDADLCSKCGKPRTRGYPVRIHHADEDRAHAAQDSARYARCKRCRDRATAAAARKRQQERNRQWGYTDEDVCRFGAPKWDVGGAAQRLDGCRTFRLYLDLPALTALEQLRKRYQQRELSARRRPKTHQLSRLVRDIVHTWETTPCPDHRAGKGFIIIEQAVGLTLDRRAHDIIKKQARARFNGNRNAALRSMIVARSRFSVSASRGVCRGTDALL